MSDANRPRPSLRRRMFSHPFTFCNRQFFQEVSDSVRFIWPYLYSEIANTHQVSGRYEFSDEFTMRVWNLRSYCLTKDFLDRYPELRGDAPQLEPSVTTYQISETNIGETMFWAKMREARNRKIGLIVTEVGHDIEGQSQIAQQIQRG